MPFWVLLLLLSWSAATGAGSAQAPPPVEQVGAREKCPVCGMFVARYPPWITQLHLGDGKVHFFDGMKDLLAYYFDPAAFGGRKGAKVTAIWAKDYYTLQWLDGRSAYYVIGSGVHGPMGHEFIPLASEEKARAFLRDHQGREILRFEEITPELVGSMRGVHTMGRGR
ncbi:nitrous oxide reductase accessory protein NosL [Desulfurivibrio sp. D14AmB]|uniref:nitrous oxide reductase accessory protein NosL n=1 Tax=Desulfurivibrio sp. D14AmB TaxID=3374370 RepID=UPI00376F0D53